MPAPSPMHCNAGGLSKQARTGEGVGCGKDEVGGIERFRLKLGLYPLWQRAGPRPLDHFSTMTPETIHWEYDQNMYGVPILPASSKRVWLRLFGGEKP